MPFIEPQLYQRYASLLPVTLLATSPSVVLSSTEVPAGNLKDFVAWASGRKGLNYGSSGNGSTPNLLWEWIKKREGIEMEHVPYRGVAMPQIQAGRVRPLAVLGNKRLAALPDVPSMKELGYDFP